METRYEYGRPALPPPPEPLRRTPGGTQGQQMQRRPQRTGAHGGEQAAASGRALRRRVKAVFCGLLFLVLFAVRALFPSAGAAIDEKLIHWIDGGWDYKTAIETVGSFASEEGLSAVAALFKGGQAEPVFLAQNGPAAIAAQGELTEALRSHFDAPKTPSPEPPAESAPPEEETEPETPAVVTAFLESQSAYADMGLPENVCYDMPDLGLACAAPALGRITDSFGWRVHPLSGEVKFHYGTDVGLEEGTELGAFADGTVYAVGDSTSLGLYLILDHGNGLRTEYAHCSELLVSAGETVTAGQAVAKAGQTGAATGPHMHLELTKDGVYLNAAYYVNFEEEAA